ncbi:type II secretory pathway component PulK [Tamilnaduibacter salinus]|uniref:Type II secretory pathway component PulK n=1 Tax=Tamilnaduibacter salinus TaxID=1484056 RepID=A0A2A2I1Q4_9GAMM|nr:type II secretion system protein GspK [Tamilnaduibacter salinus]PAV25020.1 hypothetical protein CF392_13200 [Tamilnaduibacter salinus]PVY79074.1 type II secretory pathway component PulK [Tamilnaduibacter salinus]
MGRIPAKQKGFVLAVVLWSIAALTLITGGIVARINNTLEQAYSMRELALLQQQMMATEQTLLYMLSARPHNAAGADLDAGAVTTDTSSPFGASAPEDTGGPTLRFDGTWYSGVGDSGYSLQDAGATLSLLEPRRETWLRIMELLGVPPADADRWFDQLLDYQDRDNLARLNGAEREAYQEQGLTLPPNRFPVTPHELKNLPIAGKYPEITESLIRVSTSGAGTMSNLNTSPPIMLELIHFLTESDAQQVARSRGLEIIPSLSSASSRFGMLFQGGQFQTLWVPSGNVRIMLGDAQGRHKRWIEVKFTAISNGAPWVIEYSHPVNLNQRRQEPDTTDALSPNATTEATLRASAWPYYSAFFPNQLPLE